MEAAARDCCTLTSIHATCHMPHATWAHPHTSNTPVPTHLHPHRGIKRRTVAYRIPMAAPCGRERFGSHSQKPQPEATETHLLLESARFMLLTWASAIAHSEHTTFIEGINVDAIKSNVNHTCFSKGFSASIYISACFNYALQMSLSSAILGLPAPPLPPTALCAYRPRTPLKVLRSASNRRQDPASGGPLIRPAACGHRQQP